MPARKPAKKSTAPAKKAAASKAKKAAASKGPAKKAAPKAESKAKAPAPAEPSFIREATAAERKAALEKVLEQQGLDEAVQVTKNAPEEPSAKEAPPFVRETSPADRKAVVEQLVEESGVASVLRKAPWKRATEPAAPAAAQPGEPAARPRVTMTSTPIEQTTGRSAPRVVILDSNALMMQFQFHVDIEREVQRILNFAHEIVVPTIVVGELERIAKEGNMKEQGEARMAIELAKTFKVTESPGDGDTGILRLAEKLNAVVVTNDKVLRARLRAKDIPNIYMRSRAFLTIEGHIPGM